MPQASVPVTDDASATPSLEIRPDFPANGEASEFLGTAKRYQHAVDGYGTGSECLRRELHMTGNRVTIAVCPDENQESAQRVEPTRIRTSVAS